MEEVLDVYQRPRDPERPLVCLDEFCKQLLREVREPIPAAPGQPARFDSEYIREGSATGFMIHAPLEGCREIFISQTATRTRIDYALALELIAIRPQLRGRRRTARHTAAVSSRRSDSTAASAPP